MWKTTHTSLFSYNSTNLPIHQSSCTLPFSNKPFIGRYEWQHIGSTHLHYFIWLENDMNTLDRGDAKFFFDLYISIWNPFLDHSLILVGYLCQFPPIRNIPLYVGTSHLVHLYHCCHFWNYITTTREWLEVGDLQKPPSKHQKCRSYFGGMEPPHVKDTVLHFPRWNPCFEWFNALICSQ